MFSSQLGQLCVVTMLYLSFAMRGEVGEIESEIESGLKRVLKGHIKA